MLSTLTAPCHSGSRGALSAVARSKCAARTAVAAARRRQTRQNASAAAEPQVFAAALELERLLVAILDPSAYLSEGSRQAIKTAAGLARENNSKLTVLVVDDKDSQPENAEVRVQTLTWHLKEAGCSSGFEVLERQVESKSSVLIGDVADEVEADAVLVSCDAVHSHRVDANLLAEFVPCPVLLLP